jgi:hypothetical protein
MIYGTHLPVNIAHAVDTIESSVKAFNVSISFVWKMKSKKLDPTVVASLVEQRNSVIIISTFFE